jgi:beta-glucosidase
LSDIGLPPGQLDFLRHLAAMGVRLVVVVFAGRALDLSDVLDIADTVLLAWQPGTEAGTALADVLLGTEQASGRLPVSLPRSVGHLPITHTERPGGRPLGDNPRGMGRYYDSPSSPLLPFGAGVSRVSYGDLQIVTPRVPAANGVVTVSLTVVNETDQPTREPVLLFMRDPVAQVTRPLRELVDFQVVELAAGESCEVEFSLPTTVFGYYGIDHRFRIDTGRIDITVGWPREDSSSVGVELF